MSRASWKKGGPRQEAVPVRSGRRWAVTFLSLALVLWLGWVIYQFFLPVPRTFVLAYTAGKSDKLQFPPLAFVKEDLAWLDELEYVRRVENPKFSRQDVANQLAALKMTSSDSLLVYVVAQGVSDPRQPAAFLMEPSGSKVKLGELLKAVAEAPASSKLVVLDCQRMLVDARLGLFPNEFSKHIAEEMKRINVPKLVVITTGRPGEAAALLPREQRSLFGLAFENALRTMNEKRTSRPVAVRTLYSELLLQMSHWLTRGEITQSPLLFQGGKGIVKSSTLEATINPFRFKQSLLDQKAAEKKAAEKAAAEKKLADGKGEAKPAEKPRAKPVLSPDYALADKVWTIRDRLEGDENPQWPVLFAPHLWRELKATVADDELRLRSGLAFRDEARTDLEKLNAQLAVFEAAVKQGEFIPPEQIDDTVAGRLGRAWNDYCRTDCFATWKPEAAGKPSLNQQAYRNYARAINDLPDMLALMDSFRAAGVQGIAAEGTFRNRVEEIWDAVSEFQRLLDRPPQSLTAAEINKASSRMAAARGSVRSFLRSPADDVMKQGDDRTRSDLTLRDQNILDLTLRSPLWTRAERSAWREALLLRETAFSDNVDKKMASMPAPRITLSDTVYRDVLEHFKLQANAPAPKANAKGGKTPPVNDSIGVRLVAYHSSQLLEITTPPDGKPHKPPVVKHEALSMVDARDAIRHNPKGAALCMNFPAEESWSIDGMPVELTLRQNEKRELSLQFSQKTGLPRGRLVVQFEVDRGLSLSSGGMPVGDSIAVPVSDGRATLELTLQAGAEPQLNAPPPVNLRVILSNDNGASLTAAATKVKLPVLRQLELVATSRVDRVSATWPQAGRRPMAEKEMPPAILTLPLYPNREETWSFRLRNLSAEKRVVSAQLMRVPVDAKAGYPGAINETMTKALMEGGNQFLKDPPLQEIGILTLEPGGEHALVATPVEMPKEAAKPAAVAPAVDAAKTPAEPVAGGLVLVIREVQVPNALPELFWIGWKWIQPRDYVRAVAEYDPNRNGRSLVVTLKSDGRAPPPDFAKKPIEVRGRAGATDDLPPKTAQKLGSELAPNHSAEVSIDFPADQAKRRFTVDVDGWPRAFSFFVDCTPAPAAVAINDDRSARRALQLVSVLVEKQPEYFHHNARPQFENASLLMGMPPERRLVLLGEEEPAAFLPGKTLTMRLEVDLPDAKERVSVTSDQQNQPLQEFYTDRRFEAGLVAWKDGQATIATTVGDLQVRNLDVSGRENLAERFRVELPGANGTGSSELNVVYESVPPSVNSIRTTPRVKNLELQVALELTDLPDGAASGISRARVALSSERRRPADDQFIEPKTVLNNFAQTQFVIPTKDLDRKKTYYLYGLVEDRVGNITPFGPDEVRLPNPPPPPDPAKPPVPKDRGSITGIVLYRTRPVAGVVVTLKGTGKTTRSDGEGRFEFKDLKIQDYTLEASGSVKNVSKAGMGVAKPTPDGEPQDVITVELE